MKTLKFKSKNYFTVVEMMVALILFSVIMFILLSLMTQSQNIMQRGTSKANVFEDAMMVLNRMGDDLTCADFSLETSAEYLDSDGKIRFSAITSEPSKCTILTRRYEGTSMLCKVEYEVKNNRLVERVYKFESSRNDFSNEPASEEELLDNIVAFDVIASDASYENQEDGENAINPDKARVNFDTVDDEHHPLYVTIRLVLMDDETRNIGITQQDASDPNYSPSPGDIRSRIGTDMFNARLRVLTRTVTLNLNALDSQN